MKTETYQLSLLPEQNKVIISERKGENSEWDHLPLIGSDWRKGEFHRVYVKWHDKSIIGDRMVELGHYTICDSRDDIGMDETFDYEPFSSETQELMKRDISAIIGALRGIA